MRALASRRLFAPTRAAIAAACLSTCAQPICAQAAVVIANRAQTPVRFEVAFENRQRQLHTVAPADVVSLFTAEELTVRFESGGATGENRLQPDTAYFFHDNEERLQLDEIKLPRRNGPDEQPGHPPGEAATEARLLTIGVKLLVDDEERAARPRWERRLRARLAKASAIFERYARVRFNAVAIDVWKSDDEIDDLDSALTAFETQVDPAPGKLAIGFSSQYEIPQGRVKLGGTHGPLRPHILLREWSQHISEVERLEMLVHELAHYLGAVHSPESDSVMRPVLGDRQALARQFRIRLDPLNALAVSVVADGLRSRDTGSLARFSPYTQHRLEQIYTLLGQVLPDDPAAGAFLAIIAPRAVPRRNLFAPPVTPHTAKKVANGNGREAGPKDPAPDFPLRPQAAPDSAAAPSDRQRLVTATRETLRAIVSAAEKNARLPTGRQAAHEDLYRRDGDRLAEYYVSVAADAASRQQAQSQNQSFFLALAIAIDTEHWLRDLPVLGDFLREIEPDVERAHRLELIGAPTLRGRHDLAQHFFVAAAISALAGHAPAEAAGLAKELRDADGGSGFSFRDWMADLAGISLADKLAAGTLTLRTLAGRFRADEALPPPNDLPEGLPRAEFQKRFGSTSDERFRALDREIRKRIAGRASSSR